MKINTMSVSQIQPDLRSIGAYCLPFKQLVWGSIPSLVTSWLPGDHCPGSFNMHEWENMCRGTWVVETLVGATWISAGDWKFFLEVNQSFCNLESFGVIYCLNFAEKVRWLMPWCSTPELMPLSRCGRWGMPQKLLCEFFFFFRWGEGHCLNIGVRTISLQ